MFWIRRFFLKLQSELTKPNTSQAVKPVCLATAPVIRTSLLTIFTAWALKNQSNFDRVINSHHFQLQGEFLGNLQCCNSFTGKKIVSYIKAEDGPVFTVYSEVRYVAKHCNRLKLTRYSYTVRVIFPYSHIQIIFSAFKLTCKVSLLFRFPSHHLFVWNSMKMAPTRLLNWTLQPQS